MAHPMRKYIRYVQRCLEEKWGHKVPYSWCLKEVTALTAPEGASKLEREDWFLRKVLEKYPSFPGVIR